MKIFKRFTLFIIINIILMFIVSIALSYPKRYESLINEYHYYNYNEAIVGQSHSQAGINPYILETENSKIFNLADGLMTFDDMYILVRELNKNDKLNRIYLDFDSVAWNKTDKNIYQGEGSDSNTNVLYHLSVTKHFDFEYIYNCNKYINFKDLLFDYSLNSQSLKNIINNIKYFGKINPNYFIENNMDIGTYIYKGKGFLYGKQERNMIPTVPGFSENKVTSKRLRYFNKIVNYCKENDIEIVCFTSALPPERLKNENQNDAHDYFMNLALKNNLEYYDFNYAKKEYLYRTDLDYVDKEGHMMGELADKQTTLLKEIMNSSDKEKYFYNTYEEVLNNLPTDEGN